MAMLYAKMVRWAFERLYHEFAWAYDAVAALVSGGNWRAWSRSGQQFASGVTLELGCGTGILHKALLAHPDVVALAVDRSPHMLHQARRTVGSPARLLRGDALRLPVGTATLDTIVATFPSEYIADPHTIAEIRRVLRPGGTVAVALWAQLAGDGLYLRAVDLAYRLTLQRSPRTPPQPHPPADGSTPLPAAQLRLASALHAAGFHVTHASVAVRQSRVHYVVGTLDTVQRATSGS